MRRLLFLLAVFAVLATVSFASTPIDQDGGPASSGVEVASGRAPVPLPWDSSQDAARDDWLDELEALYHEQCPGSFERDEIDYYLANVVMACEGAFFAESDALSVAADGPEEYRRSLAKVAADAERAKAELVDLIASRPHDEFRHHLEWSLAYAMVWFDGALDKGTLEPDELPTSWGTAMDNAVAARAVFSTLFPMYVATMPVGELVCHYQDPPTSAPWPDVDGFPGLEGHFRAPTLHSLEARHDAVSAGHWNLSAAAWLQVGYADWLRDLAGNLTLEDPGIPAARDAWLEFRAAWGDSPIAARVLQNARLPFDDDPEAWNETDVPARVQALWLPSLSAYLAPVECVRAGAAARS